MVFQKVVDFISGAWLGFRGAEGAPEMGERLENIGKHTVFFCKILCFLVKYSITEITGKILCFFLFVKHVVY